MAGADIPRGIHHYRAQVRARCLASNCATLHGTQYRHQIPLRPTLCSIMTSLCAAATANLGRDPAHTGSIVSAAAATASLAPCWRLAAASTQPTDTSAPAPAPAPRPSDTALSSCRPHFSPRTELSSPAGSKQCSVNVVPRRASALPLPHTLAFRYPGGNSPTPTPTLVSLPL